MAECPSHYNKREKLEDLYTVLQAENYDYVRVTMCDIHGISRGKLLPARSATKYLKKGMGAFAGMHMEPVNSICPSIVSDIGLLTIPPFWAN